MTLESPATPASEPNGDGVCSDLRVVDLSWGMAGPMVGMVLADFGASVVKIEPPGGDRFPRMPGAVQWNRGKRSLTLDLKDAGQRDEARRLCATADVLIESFRPGVAARLGVGYDDLRQLNPGLVYCSISGFGQRGPWSGIKGYEGVVLARGGLMAGATVGWRASGPIYLTLMQASAGAANFALHGILGALRLRLATGAGQRVETSLLQGAFAFQINNTIQWQDDEKVPRRPVADDARDPLCNIAGYRICRCADGAWLQLGVFQADMFHRLMVAVGMLEESEDPRFAHGPQFESDDDRKLIIRRLEEQIAREPFAHWAQAFQRHDVAYSPLQTTQEAMDDVQVRHLGLVVSVDDPALGPTHQVGPMFELRGGGWRVRGREPAADEHTREIQRALASSNAPTPPAGAARPASMLDGITVLEVATYVAAPTAIGYLVDYGADVLRVEPPGGDPQNKWGPVNTRPNRGKRSIRLDLKHPKGQEVLHRLAAEADVFVHNFRPGVAERLRIDFDTLEAINPRLVYCYAASYGSSGPYAGRPAFDPVVSALMGGEMAQAGEGNPPLIHFTSDLGAGVTTATAILAALYQRERTGKGQHVETRMLNAAAYLHSDDFLRYEGKPARRLADAGQHGLHALYRLYEAAPGWVFLAAGTDGEWRAFCQATGNVAWLNDPRFKTQEARLANDASLADDLDKLFRAGAAEDWERDLTAAGVACVCAHREFGRLLFDHKPMRDVLGTISGYHSTYGEFLQPGPLVGLSGVPSVKRVRTSASGEDTAGVLRSLGYSDAETKRLYEQNVVE